MLQLSVLSKKVADDPTAADEPYKTCLTKELDPKRLTELTFQACLENLLDESSIETYKSAFSPDLLIKTKGGKTFKVVKDLGTVNISKIAEVGLLATKRRVLKEILKEVKKIDVSSAGSD